MKYIVYCVLGGEIADYHLRLVNEIADKFGKTLTKEQGVPPHFTLKYWFDTETIEHVEKRLKQFADTHIRTPIRVGGFGGFHPKVVFMSIQLSDQARATFFELISEFKSMDWMQWDKFDAENLHFHATIVEECDEKYLDIWNFVQGQEKYFDAYFDNITVLRTVGKIKDFDKYEIYKTFILGR